MSIANHIYVFNNPAYTTKITPIDVYKKDLTIASLIFDEER
jgi:hypothetical protein